MTSVNTHEIYEKICDGETLTDDEVKVGVLAYRFAEESLIRLGPAFVVSRKECGRIRDTLQNMANARGI